jgi:hypothetical protein
VKILVNKLTNKMANIVRNKNFRERFKDRIHKIGKNGQISISNSKPIINQTFDLTSYSKNNVTLSNKTMFL